MKGTACSNPRQAGSEGLPSSGKGARSSACSGVDGAALAAAEPGWGGVAAGEPVTEVRSSWLLQLFRRCSASALDLLYAWSAEVLACSYAFSCTTGQYISYTFAKFISDRTAPMPTPVTDTEQAHSDDLEGFHEKMLQQTSVLARWLSSVRCRWRAACCRPTARICGQARACQQDGGDCPHQTTCARPASRQLTSFE